jgi:hypothetical protein
MKHTKRKYNKTHHKKRRSHKKTKKNFFNKHRQTRKQNGSGKYKPNDIYNSENRVKVIDNFLSKLEISKEESYTKNMLDILFMPVVELTNNDPNIIWFDINSLRDLENWVSKKLNSDFKMEKINIQNPHVVSNLVRSLNGNKNLHKN